MLTRDVRSLIGNETEYRWNNHTGNGSPVVITYSFGENEADYAFGRYNGYETFSAAHKSHIRAAMETWDETSGVTFVEVPDTFRGDIRFSMVNLEGQVNAVGRQVSGFGNYPFVAERLIGDGFKDAVLHNNIGGDIFLNANFYADSPNSISPGIRGYSIVLHEIGHTLGFKHPFEGNPKIAPSHDNGRFTVLSYDRPHSTTELGSVDLAAMKYVYGNEASSFRAFWSKGSEKLVQFGTNRKDDLAGSHLDDRISGGKGKDKIFTFEGDDKANGGKGRDFLYLGSGDDNGNGGKGRDVIYGEGGDDILNGRQGGDRLIGGEGADRFIFTATSGRDVIEDFAAGEDVLVIRSGADGLDDLSIRQDGANTIITFEQSKVTLENEDAGLIAAEDNFIF